MERERAREGHAGRGGERPNFEKRALASVQRQPNYLQSVYMMQNLLLFIDFSTIQNTGGQRSAAMQRIQAGCGRLDRAYLRIRISPHDRPGGSSGCTQISSPLLTEEGRAERQDEH